MKHSYTVKDMSGGMGLRMWYEFEDKNAKGAEICRRAFEEVSD